MRVRVPTKQVQSDYFAHKKTLLRVNSAKKTIFIAFLTRNTLACGVKSNIIEGFFNKLIKDSTLEYNTIFLGCNFVSMFKLIWL